MAKINPKIDCWKQLKNYYLEVQHLIPFDYHYLVATLTDCSMLYAPCHFVSFFPFENRVPKCPKTVAHLFVNNLQKFRKFTVSSISRLGDIKDVSYKDWKMSLYKPFRFRACFYWITGKSQIIQLKISFHHDNFRVDFFQRRKFCHI